MKGGRSDPPLWGGQESLDASRERPGVTISELPAKPWSFALEDFLKLNLPNLGKITNPYSPAAAAVHRFSSPSPVCTCHREPSC